MHKSSSDLGTCVVERTSQGIPLPCAHEYELTSVHVCLMHTHMHAHTQTHNCF